MLRGSIAFEVCDALCGSGHLLIERGSFPFQCVYLAIGFMQLALERADVQGNRGMIAACRLMLFAGCLQLIRRGLQLPLNFHLPLAKILMLVEKRLMFCGE